MENTPRARVDQQNSKYRNITRGKTEEENQKNGH